MWDKLDRGSSPRDGIRKNMEFGFQVGNLLDTLRYSDTPTLKRLGWVAHCFVIDSVVIFLLYNSWYITYFIFIFCISVVLNRDHPLCYDFWSDYFIILLYKIRCNTKRKCNREKNRQELNEKSSILFAFSCLNKLILSSTHGLDPRP